MPAGGEQGDQTLLCTNAGMGETASAGAIKQGRRQAGFA